jgi:cytochrome c556
MPHMKIALLTLAALLSAGTIAAASADTPMTASAAVAARQAAMKQDGRALRGSTKFTSDAAVKALTIVEANYTKLPGLFPQGSATDKSSALPIIWTQFDQFSAIFKKGAAAATDGIAAAKAGDMAKYVADIKIIGGTCDECHQTYRAKDE